MRKGLREDSRLSYVYYGLIVANGAQHFKASELPLATLGRVYRADPDVSMNGGGVLVDEFQCVLCIVSLTHQFSRYTEREQ